MKKTEEAMKEVKELKKKARSKWSKGVFDYVFDFERRISDSSNIIFHYLRNII